MNKRKVYQNLNLRQKRGISGQKNDSTDYLDWSKAKPVRFPNLKATSRTISIRLPESLIEEIRVLANKQDVPYQSLLKILLADKVRENKQLSIAVKGKPPNQSLKLTEPAASFSPRAKNF